MKIYKQLQLKPEKRTYMARLWHSWCRRRAALSQQLATALKSFSVRPLYSRYLCAFVVFFCQGASSWASCTEDFSQVDR